MKATVTLFITSSNETQLSDGTDTTINQRIRTETLEDTNISAVNNLINSMNNLVSNGTITVTITK